MFQNPSEMQFTLYNLKNVHSLDYYKLLQTWGTNANTDEAVGLHLKQF